MSKFTGAIMVLMLTVMSFSSYGAFVWQEKPKAQHSNQQVKININEATVKQLANLKGVGPKKAQAIVDFIAAQGKLTSIEELKMVKGVGSKLLKRITPYIYIAKRKEQVAKK